MPSRKTFTPRMSRREFTAVPVASSSAAFWKKKSTTTFLFASAFATGTGSPTTFAGWRSARAFSAGLVAASARSALDLALSPALASRWLAPFAPPGLPPAKLPCVGLGAGGATAAWDAGSAAVRAPRAARKVAAMSIAPTRVRSSGRETAIRALSDGGGRMFSGLSAVGLVRGPHSLSHHLYRRLARGPQLEAPRTLVHEHLQALHHPAPGRCGPGSQRRGSVAVDQVHHGGGRVDRSQPQLGHGLLRGGPAAQAHARAVHEQVRGLGPVGLARPQLSGQRRGPLRRAVEHRHLGRAGLHQGPHHGARGAPGPQHQRALVLG